MATAAQAQRSIEFVPSQFGAVDKFIPSVENLGARGKFPVGKAKRY